MFMAQSFGVVALGDDLVNTIEVGRQLSAKAFS